MTDEVEKAEGSLELKSFAVMTLRVPDSGELSKLKAKLEKTLGAESKVALMN